MPLTRRLTKFSTTWICCSRSSSFNGPFQMISTATPFARSSSRALNAPALTAFQNSFVVPLGHGWYRYHAMFGQALRLIARHESPAEVRELHRRAATWFDRDGGGVAVTLFIPA